MNRQKLFLGFACISGAAFIAILAFVLGGTGVPPLVLWFMYGFAAVEAIVGVFFLLKAVGPG